jgi:hypothetical protein
MQDARVQPTLHCGYRSHQISHAFPIPPIKPRTQSLLADWHAEQVAHSSVPCRSSNAWSGQWFGEKNLGTTHAPRWRHACMCLTPSCTHARRVDLAFRQKSEAAAELPITPDRSKLSSGGYLRRLYSLLSARSVPAFLRLPQLQRRLRHLRCHTPPQLLLTNLTAVLPVHRCHFLLGGTAAGHHPPDVRPRPVVLPRRLAFAAADLLL